MLKYPMQRISDDRRSRTYIRLVEETEELAKRLCRQKYGILCSSDVLNAEALLACMAAGVTAVPLSNRYGELYNKKLIKSMRLSYLLVEEGGKIKVRNCGAVHSEIEKELEGITWLLPTSGTTGQPKGVLLSGEAILQNLRDSDTFFLSEPGDKILAGRGFFHCSSLTGELLMSLIRGVEICCYAGGFQPHQLAEEIIRKQITVYSGTPTVFHYLCRVMGKQKSHIPLRYCNVGGEMMNRQTLTAIGQVLKGTQVIHSYGMTESCSRATYLKLGDEELPENCVGRTLPGLSAMIIDKQGNPLGEGKEGEICLTGTGIMSGYYHDHEQTDKALKDSWLRTGDMGWKDCRGRLYICGRKDDMIIRAGVNIYPREIEEPLKEHPDIKEARVYAEQGEGITKRLAALIVPEEGCWLSDRELMEICSQRLPRYLIPDRIQIAGEMELSQAGKRR